MKSPSSSLYIKYFRYNVPPPPIQRGIDHVTEAREDYRTIQKAIHENTKVHLLGIRPFQKHSSFVASSDGRVIENENTG